MAPTRADRRRPAVSLSLNVLSLSLGLAYTACAHSQQAEQQPQMLAPVQVQGEGVRFQQQTLASGKFTELLRDTPQSISVIPQDVIQQQGAQSLQDVLRNVPGITFTSGEGNLGWGDMFTIRGFSSEQSIMVDGLRDGGLSSRNDTFNLERAEVFKGTGSLDSGVGGVGGSVNLVSKEAHLGDAYGFSSTLGPDRYRRVTADLNRQLGEHSAARINLMRHTNEVAGRDVTRYDRRGVAGSLAFGLGEPTRVTVDFFHQEDKDIPDGGVPILRNSNGRRMPGVPRDAWYGDPNLFTERTTTDQATLKVEHDFNQRVRLSNVTRWQQTDRISVLSPARFNSAAGTSYGYVGVGPLVSSDSGILSYGDYAYQGGSTAARLRGADFGMSKRYSIVANQTNLNFEAQTGGIKHAFATGVEFYRERYGDHERTLRAPGSNPLIDLSDSQGADMGAVDTVKGTGGAYAEVKNVGLYLADSMTLSPQWLAQGVLRYDHYDVTQVSGTGTARVSRTQDDGAWSGRLGLTYKPVEYGSLYVSYSQAAQPSAVGASSNNVVYGLQEQKFKPAQSRTYEAGTKWDLLDERLSVTGAVFRTELSDSWEYGDTTSVVRSLPAKRVDGIELGVAGSITKRFSAFAGLSAMKSRITKGANKGEEARNVPDLTLNLWASYLATNDLTLSYGVQYVGHRRYTDNRYVGGLNNNSSTVDGPSGKHPIYVRDDEQAPSYWMHSVAARYALTRNITVGANIDNLFDTFYYSRVGASLDGFQLYGVPGPGRTYTMTVDARF